MSTSPMYAYMGKESVDERKLRSSNNRRHLYRVVCPEQCVLVLMAFLTRTIRSSELAIQNLLGNDARMRIGTCGGILLQLPQHMHDFVCDIKVQDLVEWTRFDFLLLIWSYGDSKS